MHPTCSDNGQFDNNIHFMMYKTLSFPKNISLCLPIVSFTQFLAPRNTYYTMVSNSMPNYSVMMNLLQIPIIQKHLLLLPLNTWLHFYSQCVHQLSIGSQPILLLTRSSLCENNLQQMWECIRCP